MYLIQVITTMFYVMSRCIIIGLSHSTGSNYWLGFGWWKHLLSAHRRRRLQSWYDDNDVE